MSKNRENKTVVIPDVQRRFLKKLGMDFTIDWTLKRLSARSLAVDVLYLLGLSIDSVKYGGVDGFIRFQKEIGIHVDLQKRDVSTLLKELTTHGQS